MAKHHEDIEHRDSKYARKKRAGTKQQGWVEGVSKINPPTQLGQFTTYDTMDARYRRPTMATLPSGNKARMMVVNGQTKIL